jgi:hypothetical protein
MPPTDKQGSGGTFSNPGPVTPPGITLNYISPELARKYRNSRPLKRPPRPPIQPRK